MAIFRFGFMFTVFLDGLLKYSIFRPVEEAERTKVTLHARHEHWKCDVNCLFLPARCQQRHSQLAAATERIS